MNKPKHMRQRCRAMRCAEEAAAQEHAKVASGSKEHHRTHEGRRTSQPEPLWSAIIAYARELLQPVHPELLNWAKNQGFSGLIPCQERDVVILFVHLIVVSYPARLLLACVGGSNLILAEFPSLMLGTAKTVESGNPQRGSIRRKKTNSPTCQTCHLEPPPLPVSTKNSVGRPWARLVVLQVSSRINPQAVGVTPRKIDLRRASEYPARSAFFTRA